SRNEFASGHAGLSPVASVRAVAAAGRPGRDDRRALRGHGALWVGTHCHAGSQEIASLQGPRPQIPSRRLHHPGRPGSDGAHADQRHRYRPVSARYKVYIIDEVHMLSEKAFNALLKTLEEPPPHVKFVFATTEIRKVPVTVLSRCQRFDLKRVPMEALTEWFGKIAGLE